LGVEVFFVLSGYEVEISDKAVLLVLAATVGLAVLDRIGVPRGGTAIKYLLLPALLALAVNLLDQSPQFIRNLLSMRWLRWLGTCSFSIYLWHYPFYVLLHRGAWPFGRVSALACGVAAGALSFYLFEQPMRTLLRGSGRKAASVGLGT
jgi:peptidoglycan/LPS O-acetylase OafA/YrhL